ncbi:hypothetical protein J6590_062856 [Homalodisca vitripennis]|nr:hypothetical protein J6590_062856 [Homalodisca vitripennis]
MYNIIVTPQEGLDLPVEPTLGTAKTMCSLNLGNFMDVQDLLITNRKCRDVGEEECGSIGPTVDDDY